MSVINMIMSAVALIIGGAMYVLFRENTYVAEAINSVCDIDWMRSLLSCFKSDFAMYYLPDFLWAFSMCTGLLSIFSVTKIRLIIIAFVTVLAGALWEALQYADIVRGTGDVIDILLYLAASIIAVVINYYFIRRTK